MPFAPLDVLVGIEPTDVGGFLHRFHRLGIHHSGARMWIFTNPSPLSLSQFPIEMAPDPCAAELAKVIIDRLPRRKIRRQIAPRAAGAHQVKERIKDATRRMT